MQIANWQLKEVLASIANLHFAFCNFPLQRLTLAACGKACRHEAAG
jgi:hypothetical protein